VTGPSDAVAKRLPGWLSGESGRWLIAVRVQPGARRTEAAGEHDGALKVRVGAPPVEGRANEALLRWFAERLDLPQRDVALTSGASRRSKRVRVDARIDAAEVVARLLSR